MPRYRLTACAVGVFLAAVLSRTPAEPGVVVLVNRLANEIQVEVDAGYPPRSFRVPAAGIVPIFALTPPVVRIQSAASLIEERADLNAIYEIAPRGDSLMMRAMHIGNIRPGVWILPSTKKVERRVAIPIAVYADDEQPALPEVWQQRLRRQIAAASEFVEWFCGARFEIVKMGTWNSDNRPQSLELLLEDFRQKVPLEDALLVLGVSSQLRVPQNAIFHYPGGLLESHFLIPDVQETYTAQMQLMTLIHLFGHFLGAVDIFNEQTVMNPAKKTLEVEKDKRDYFDPVNTLIMNLVVEELAFRNVRQVKDLSSSTRNYLVGVYRFLGYRSRRPDAQRLFMRFEDSPISYERFVGEWTDGSLVTGAEIFNWGDPHSAPELAGKRLFGSEGRIRWIVDTQPAESPPSSESFVEFVGGDRLPGKVMGTRPAEVVNSTWLPPRLVVYPHTRLFWPDGPFRDRLEVFASHAKRIVWKPCSERYQPGWAFLSDGRRLRFQAVQWGENTLRFLTDDGIRTFGIEELAELHLQGADAWENLIKSRVGLIESPDDILMEMECADGLRVTTSLKRFLPRSRGDKNLPESWFHMVQPPWSTDPLWIPYRAVVWRSFFEAAEIPLSRLEPLHYQEATTLGGRWGFSVDENLLGRRLQSAGRLFGWGLGVPSGSQFAFPLHPLVTSVSLQLGLDSEVGDGGCIWGEIRLDGKIRETLARSPVLIGSHRVFDPGNLSLIGRNLENTLLVLAVDEAEQDRPPAADPWNIRDLANWLEPVLYMDKEKWVEEIYRRNAGLIPCWSGWRVVADEPASTPVPQIVSELDTISLNSPRFRWVHVFKGHFSLQRTLLVPSDAQSLQVLVCRPGGTDSYRLDLLGDGTTVGGGPVPERTGPQMPQPFQVDLRPLRGQRVNFRIILQGDSPDREYRAEWHLIRVVRSSDQPEENR